MSINIRIIIISGMFCLSVAGCASHKHELGSEVAEQLGVNSSTLEETEKGVEKIYDANTLMKRAEAYYDSDNYIEASAEYQRFLEMHPLHELAPHAQFRIGKCFYKMVSTIDRDPEPAIKAIEAFKKVLSEYPGSKYVEESKSNIEKLKRQLLKHEIYIGKFYYKKGNYNGSIYRLENVITKYPESDSIDEAMYYLSLSYNQKGNEEKGKEIFNEMIKRFPNTRFRKL